MISAPFFSVVIPTHNRVQRLRRALTSVAAQSFDDYELVVVDDASSDATPEFLKNMASERCRTFRNENSRGASGARNEGCALARGEYIVFLDDDDALRPTALAQIRARIRAAPELDFLWGGRLRCQRDGSGRLVTTEEDDWSLFARPVRGSEVLPVVLSIATSAAFTIRRSVFRELGGFDENLRVSEDRDLFIRLARSGRPGCAVGEIIIEVDEHVDSLSRNTGLKLVPGSDLRVIERYRDYLELPEHRDFLHSYLREVYSGFLKADDRAGAMRIVRELHGRRALSLKILRMYVRNASEFRLLKRLLRYDAFRRFKSGLVS